MDHPIPDPSLVILVGPSGSGKSTWAEGRFRQDEIVSSDRLRSVVGSGEGDLDASADAFDLLDRIVTARLRRRLLTVVDTLGFDKERRDRHIDLAHEAGLPVVLVGFDTPEPLIRSRNQARARRVPEKVLTSQIRRYREIRPALGDLDFFITARDQGLEPVHAPGSAVAASRQVSDPTGFRFYLQLSRFSFDPISEVLCDIVAEAERIGFTGVAVMDHLQQIPQVGREWEAIPEAYSTLAYLAALTTKLELGALVTGVSLRNPGLLAKIIATIDVLSGGRTFCGLGAGWHKAEQISYGFEFGSPRKRLEQLEDALHILPLMWAPGKASYSGRHFTVTDAVCYPRPLQPHIPMIVGGRGHHLVDLALRLADGLNVNLPHLDRVEAQVGETLATLDKRFAISVLDTPIVGGGREEVAGLIEQHRGNRPASEFASRHHAGTVDVHIGRYRKLHDRGVRAAFVAPVGLNGPDDLHPWEDIVGAFGD